MAIGDRLVYCIPIDRNSLGYRVDLMDRDDYVIIGMAILYSGAVSLVIGALVLWF